MITKYVDGYVPQVGKKGSLVQRVLSSREVITSLRNPRTTERTTQQALRGAHNVLIGSWNELTEVEKQTWKNVISSPNYPPVDDRSCPVTANNLFYQVNDIAKNVGIDFLRTAPNYGFLNEYVYIYFQPELLPDKIVVKVELINVNPNYWVQLYIGNANNVQRKSMYKELRYAGIFRIPRLTTIDLTDVYKYYWGNFDYRYDYLYAEARPWDISTFDKSTINYGFERVKPIQL